MLGLRPVLAALWSHRLIIEAKARDRVLGHLWMNSELYLGADIVVPDLAGWRRDRLLELPDIAYFEMAPDWACEVLSPRTEEIDRVEKMEIYGRERVSHVWLINPEVKLLEVYRLEAEKGLYARLSAFHGDARVRAEPFDAIEIQLAPLWSL